MIKIEHLSKNFGDLEVLKDINLEVKEGEVVCIIGPSGSGRAPCCAASTSWRLPPAARSTMRGVSTPEPEVRCAQAPEEVGMVFQRFNLFPLKTVKGNITAAPVKIKR